ncbi:MAG: sugar transferase [Ignavibacteriales bacterium]
MPVLLNRLLSLAGLILLLPLLIIIAAIIKLDSRGGILYKQPRVGKNNREFYLYKFRTMRNNSDRNGLLTVGEKDSRITRAGYYLRKYKLDELPQLLNVVKGDMRLVGPRPEVRKYVDLYTEEQKTVLNVEPGITDPASIRFRNESEILKKAENPEQFYINYIMPRKLNLNLQYLGQRSFLKDINVIFNTFYAIIKRRTP